MSFFTTDKSVDKLQESSMDFIKEGGIYDVTLDAVSVDTNAKGARSLNFNIDYKGSKTTLYGLRLDNNDGSENFQRPIFNKLCVVLGIDEVTAPEKQTHMLGRDRKPAELMVLDQFTGEEVKVRVQYVYTRYNGKIIERREIKSFYRASDGASALEITNGEKFGEQMAKDLAYCKPIYKDGITEEEVEAWKLAKSGKTPTPTATTPSASVNPF
ncbi:MAG: hypothetical protein KGV43_02910 [Arcobacter sp.]|nr:hypothetical protein [Arcobacter sp.]